MHKYISIYKTAPSQVTHLTAGFSKIAKLGKSYLHLGSNPPHISQKGFIKFTKHTLVSYLIVSTVLVGTGLIFLFNPFGGVDQAEAAWFNDNWSFRKTLTFTHNATVSSATKVKFDIDTTAAPTDFQADCGDVRFTSPNGDILPYYYDSAGGACDTSSTDFYVLIPSIINGSNYIYMYYGNPSVVDGTRSANFSESTTTPSGGAATPGSEEKAPSPVAYWKFDDGQGTTVQDSGINNLDASIVNNSMSWKTEDNCIAGKCLANTIDGTGLARVASNTKFQQTSNVSWNIWARMSQISSSNWPTIMSHSDTHTGYGIRYNKTTGKVYFERGISTCDGQSGNYSAIDFNGSNSFADNNWHMLTMTQDGTNINLYYDGKFVSSTADSAFCSSSGLLLYFGHQAGGSIDEAKIYNYPLSAAQVAANYNARSNPEGVSSALGANTQNMPDALSDGLVGYWKMDESSWTIDCSTSSALDSSGNGNSGKSCPNSTGPAGGAIGKFGNAGSFDGTNDYVDIPTSTALNPTSAVTVSSWVYPTATPGVAGEIILKQDVYGIRINSSSAIAAILSAGGVWTNISFSGATLTQNAWSHVVLTWDTNGDAKARLYVNGVLSATSSAVSGALISNSNDVVIGGNSGGTRQVTGKIDEARVYNRALSGAEVSQLYNWAPGPVGYWKFDEGSWNGTTNEVKDASGFGNNGISACTGTCTIPTTTQGKYGKGGSFDGVDDYVTIDDSTSISMTSQLTASAWINPIAGYGGAGNRGILEQKNDSWGFMWVVGASGLLSGRVYQSDATQINITTSQVIPTNTWSYVTLTADPISAKAYLYYNGVQVGSTSYNGTLRNGTLDFIVGTQGFGTNDYFNGKIDDVKLYNYTRTQAQIIEDMNAGHPAPGSPVSSAVAHWKLDEGYGTSAQDYSGNSNTLTLSTATSAWTNSGKFLKAFDGNGTRYMSKSDDSDFDVSATDDYAVSMWFKSDSASNPAATEYLFNKENATNPGYAVYVNTSGQFCFAIDDDTTWSPDVASCTSADYYDASWHHLAAVRNVTADTISIFIDGQQKDSDTDTTTATLANSLSLYAADRDGTDNADEFNGDLDEIKVYRSPLTTSQIDLDMNRSASQVLGASGTTSNTQPNAAANEYCPPDSSAAACTGPVAEWKYDVVSSTSVDTSGNGNSISWFGGAAGNPSVPGKFNYAKSSVSNFGGVTDAAVLRPGTGSWTVSTWLKNPSGSASRQIINKHDGLGYGYMLCQGGAAPSSGCSGTTGTKVAFGYASSSGTNFRRAITTDNVFDGNWHYITAVADQAADTIKIYVDGKLVPVTATAGGSWPDVSNTSQLNFLSSTGSVIDQTTFFNYARTPAQIAWDYNKGGPVAWWKMDECQGTVINDASGNSLTGTLTIGATGTNTTAGTCQTSGAWFDGATGKRNYSMDFDGTDDYISVADNTTSLRPTNVSVSAWVKLGSNFASNKVVVSKRTGFNSNEAFVLYVNGVGSRQAAFGISTTGSNEAGITGTTVLTTGNWYHLIGTYDGTTTRLYVNGIQEVSGTASSGSMFASTANLAIGSGAGSSASASWDGQIDDAKMYNYPLTATQVKTLYNEGTYRTGPSTGAP